MLYYTVIYKLLHSINVIIFTILMLCNSNAIIALHNCNICIGNTDKYKLSEELINAFTEM